MHPAYIRRIDGTCKPAIVDLVEPCVCPHWTITRIDVPEGFRHLGHGSILLRRVLREADREGVTLCLSPWANGAHAGGPTQEQLVAWYQRFGFVLQAQGSKCGMIREPSEEPPWDDISEALKDVGS